MSYEGLPLDITKGGTNATSAAAARTNLGIGSGSDVTFANVTLANGGALRTGTTAADTALIRAYDVDGASYTTFATLTANNTPTMDLDDAVTKAGQYIYRVGGTDVSVADGGTGLSILTAHALYVGNGTAAPTPIAVGATGTVLQGNTGANPTFSTATFPSTATGTGTILRADGTNWVATTATYPATTTINQILYSSAGNTVTGLATANTAVLATDGSGVPSITATPAVTSITLSGGTALANYVQTVWTPTITGSSVNPTSITYSAQNGTYTRIGNVIVLWCNVTVSALTFGSASGNFQVSGLPFAANSAAPSAQGTIAWDNIDIGTAVQLTPFILNNTQVIRFDQSTDTGARTQLVIGGLQSNTSIDLTIIYRV